MLQIALFLGMAVPLHEEHTAWEPLQGAMKPVADFPEMVCEVEARRTEDGCIHLSGNAYGTGKLLHGGELPSDFVKKELGDAYARHERQHALIDFFDQRINIFATSFVLRDEKTGRLYRLPTMYAGDRGLENTSQERAGFAAFIDEGRLEADRSYEVGILYRNNQNNLLLNTGKSIQRTVQGQ